MAGKAFIAFVIFTMFAILVLGAGAQARLPTRCRGTTCSRFSGKMRKGNPRTQTPIIALLVFAVVDIGVMIYGYN